MTEKITVSASFLCFACYLVSSVGEEAAEWYSTPQCSQAEPLWQLDMSSHPACITHITGDIPSWEIRPSQVLQLWDKDEHYYWIKEKMPLLISRLGTDSPLSHSTVNHDLFPYRQEHHCGITLSGAENETLGLILALLWVRLSSISPKTNHYPICL